MTIQETLAAIRSGKLAPVAETGSTTTQPVTQPIAQTEPQMSPQERLMQMRAQTAPPIPVTPTPRFSLPPAPEKTPFLTKASDFLVGAEKGFANTIGTAMSVIDPQTQNMRNETLANNQKQVDNYISMAKYEPDKKRKSNLLKAAQSLADTSNIDIYNNPEYQKTAKQIIGEAAGTTLDILTAGSYSKAGLLGEKALTTGLEKSLPSAAKALVAVPKLTTKQMVGQGVKIGAPLGMAYGASGAMQNNEDLGGIVKSSLIGGATGGVLGGATGFVAGKMVNRAPAIERINTKIENELFNVQNNYAKLRKVNLAQKDAGAAARKMVVEADVLEGAILPDGHISTKGPNGPITKFIEKAIGPKEDIVGKLLEREGASVSPEVVIQKLNEEIMGSKLQGAALSAAQKKVPSEIEGLMLRANPDGSLPLTLIHDAKKVTANMVDYTTPGSKEVQAAIASAYRRIIEEISNANIKPINAEIAKVMKGVKLLEDLDGRIVRGGKLGKYFAQIAGNIIGGAAGGAIGGPGGMAIGTVLGGEISGRIKSKSIQGVFGKSTGSILKKSPIIEEAIKEANKPRLMLPAPKAGSPRSSIGSGPTIKLPAKSQSTIDSQLYKLGTRNTKYSTAATKINAPIESKVNKVTLPQNVAKVNVEKAPFTNATKGAILKDVNRYVSFVSPNTRTDVTLGEAIKLAASKEHKQNVKLFDKINESLKLKGKTHTGIGEWGDGAENTTYFIGNNVDRETAIYAEALKAKATRQKQFIWFEESTKGSDQLLKLKTNGTSIEKLKEVFDKNGITFKTFGDDEILVFNKSGEYFDSELADKLIKVTEELKLTPGEIMSGEGDFVGSWMDGEGARDDAIKNFYDPIIKKYEQSRTIGKTTQSRLEGGEPGGKGVRLNPNIPTKTKIQKEINPKDFKTVNEFVKAHGDSVYRGSDKSGVLKESLDTDYGPGYYFANKKSTADSYGKFTDGYFVKLNNPLEVKDRYAMNGVFDDYIGKINSGKVKDFGNIQAYLKSLGYDGIKVRDGGLAGQEGVGGFTIAFDKNSIRPFSNPAKSNSFFNEIDSLKANWNKANKTALPKANKVESYFQKNYTPPFLDKETRVIPVSKLQVRGDVNPKSLAVAKERMAEALKTGETRKPLTAIQLEDGSYKIIDGNTTLQALKDLGVKNAIINVRKTAKVIKEENILNNNSLENLIDLQKKFKDEFVHDIMDWEKDFGLKIDGLEFAAKTKSSIESKYIRRDKNPAKISDTLRTTYALESQEAIKQVEPMLKAATDKGYRIVELESKYPAKGKYLDWLERNKFGWKDVNVKMLSPEIENGQHLVVEIQFNTPNILKAKTDKGFATKLGFSSQGHVFFNNWRTPLENIKFDKKLLNEADRLLVKASESESSKLYMTASRLDAKQLGIKNTEELSRMIGEKVTSVNSKLSKETGIFLD